MNVGNRLPRRQILVGDAGERLRELPAGSVDMVLTSPPYFRLRDYQVNGQLGMEQHVGNWVDQLRAVCSELARVLVPSGSLWLNLGDTYTTHPRQGAARKSLLLGPERLALALIEDGWIIRNKIVWAKTNPMPSPVRDRLSCTWEVMFLLTRSRSAYFDLDAIRQPHKTSGKQRPSQPIAPVLPSAWQGPNGDGGDGLSRLKAQGRVGHPLGKNPGDVWQMATAGYRGGHYAVMPERLAQRAITAGCPQQRCTSCRRPWQQHTLRALGGTALRGALGPSCECAADSEPGLVLDPFLGAGTTAVVAEKLERDWLGIELNPAFAGIAEQRLAAGAKRPPQTEQMTNKDAA